LSRSVVASRTLEEAVSDGYTACSRCRPPAPDFPVDATPRPKSDGYARSDKENTVTRSVDEEDDFPILGLAAFSVAFLGIWWLLAKRK